MLPRGRSVCRRARRLRLVSAVRPHVRERLRARRVEVPEAVSVPLDLDARLFWKRVRRGSRHACWEWTGARSEGYGVLTFKGQPWLAHRLAYTLRFGPIPPGLVAHHELCANRACVNPRHLRVMSPSEHSRRHAQLKRLERTRLAARAELAARREAARRVPSPPYVPSAGFIAWSKRLGLPTPASDAALPVGRERREPASKTSPAIR